MCFALDVEENRAKCIRNVDGKENLRSGSCILLCDIMHTPLRVMLMLPLTSSAPLAISLVLFPGKVPTWIKICYSL